ncbi:MAG: O-antigen ligase family protein, partial [Thermoanaerobaculia bacterium]|nr:O-antigen ligase family protein [Thermoanaerobaculia bacterium]
LARIKEAHIYGRVFQPRIAGPIGDPNFFAQILLIAFPPAVIVGAQASSKRIRALWLVAAGIILITLGLTYSRGAMVALVVVGLMLLKALHIHWRTTAAVIALLIVTLVLLPPTVTKRFLTIEQILPTGDEPLRPDSSFQERKLLMQVAWIMFGANPALGVGAGNYTTRYDDYVDLTGSAARQYAEAEEDHYPHNLYLEVAAEGGLLGIVAFGAVILAAWTALARTRRRSGDPLLRSSATAFQISLAGFLVTGIFLHLAFPRYLFLVFAFAASLQRMDRRDPSSQDFAE